METHQEAINRILQADPNVVQFLSAVSDTSSNGLNNGNAFLHLRDLSDRPWTDSPAYDRLIAQLRHHARARLAASVSSALFLNTT